MENNSPMPIQCTPHMHDIKAERGMYTSIAGVKVNIQSLIISYYSGLFSFSSDPPVLLHCEKHPMIYRDRWKTIRLPRN